MLVRLCIRKTVPEDGDEESGKQLMDVDCQSALFTEYESKIRDAVKRLNTEHNPMEYNDAACHDHRNTTTVLRGKTQVGHWSSIGQE
ncbi:hypothetical protein F2P81_013146 [Scophthalmus maximus]|uniref:Uncharacterized protein n=1 Tax=Scophthalmus maximus TaxID=52904 RepID=A0A6A4ST89_SCOMX|nr:hypothetical protein F2P81_013146 [Scophthalmus maximus]